MDVSVASARFAAISEASIRVIIGVALTFVEKLTVLTATTIDDQVVAFLRSVVADDKLWHDLFGWLFPVPTPTPDPGPVVVLSVDNMPRSIRAAGDARGINLDALLLLIGTILEFIATFFKK